MSALRCPRSGSLRSTSGADNSYKWRSRYRSDGVEGLKESPAAGAAPEDDAEKAKQILDWTTHRVPVNRRTGASR